MKPTTNTRAERGQTDDLPPLSSVKERPMFSLLKSPAAAARFGLGGILALTAAFLLAAQGVHSADDPPDPDETVDDPAVWIAQSDVDNAQSEVDALTDDDSGDDPVVDDQLVPARERLIRARAHLHKAKAHAKGGKQHPSKNPLDKKPIAHLEQYHKHMRARSRP